MPAAGGIGRDKLEHAGRARVVQQRMAVVEVARAAQHDATQVVSFPEAKLKGGIALGFFQNAALEQGFRKSIERQGALAERQHSGQIGVVQLTNRHGVLPGAAADRAPLYDSAPAIIV